jgi:photosynthetic reaction center cytochrome c subunit
VQNYAADEWDDEEAMANKMRAREHLRMTQDLNQNWLTQLPGLTEDKQPSGAQITCATCHFGEAQPVTWPEGEFALPDDFRLPLEASLSGEEIDLLNVNGRDDISLDTVQYNQQVMYYMNASMNVGCTHCHNSRYFPSWEVPAKYYAQHMLQMTQYIYEEWGDSLGGQEPSCLMCHYGAAIPPGAAQSVDVMPDVLVAP